MSEEKNEVALVTLPSVPAELEAAFIDEKFIASLIENVRTKSLAVVGDLNTTKGRKAYISMSANVRSTKAMIDEAGKNLVAEIKKRPAMIDAGRKTIRDALDDLAVEIRKPVTDWEAEQERIRIEEEAKKAAEELAKQVDSDHEIALLMNEKFDRDVADAKLEAERIQKEHEERIAKEAAEKARLEAEATAQREREAALQREADLKAQAALAEANRIASEKKAEQDRIDAANKAESDRLAAAQQAEREKQEAIAAEQLKAKQKEDARLAEEKRIADEAAARAANIEHQKAINNQVIAILAKAGISPDCAKECVIAIVKNQNAAAASVLPAPVQINY